MNKIAANLNEIIKNKIPPSKGGVLALGNFDGVHGGHQAVVAAARRYGLAARVLTFEPHPRRVFQPQHPPFRLTPAPVKERLLRALGVDDVIVMDFSQDLAHLSARAFVDEVLLGRYGAQHVVAGHDFVFGHKRGGTMPLLREWLAPHGVEVTEVAPLRDAEGEILSSSRVRDALRRGDLATAQRILGRPWAIAGIVRHGAQRGATIGFPTANMDLGDYLRPPFGVYAVRARRVGAAESYAGVANLGIRPTVDGVRETLETHLFDFDQDIYDQEWEIELRHFLRPEQTFPNLESLRAQIAKDVTQAKALP